MTFYAAVNFTSNISRRDDGFQNSWEIARFETRNERDEFVWQYKNHSAYAVTRKRAAQIWANCYKCAGKKAPPGGLFANTDEWPCDPYDRFYDAKASRWHWNTGD